MKPRINKTQFGSIAIGEEIFNHDIVIRLNGEIEKRKKKLSKEVYGSSHIISREEAKYIYEKDAEEIIIGTGQQGMVELSEEAVHFFERKNCKVMLMPTPEAIKAWNKAKGKVIGLFHVTC